MYICLAKLKLFVACALRETNGAHRGEQDAVGGVWVGVEKVSPVSELPRVQRTLKGISLFLQLKGTKVAQN